MTPQQSQPFYQQMHTQMAPTNIQNGGQGQLGFNSNVKVVELDTKVSEGYFYSGSNNLDPFSKK